VPPEVVRDVGRAEGLECGGDMDGRFAFGDEVLASLLARLRRHHAAEPSLIGGEGTAREAILRVLARAADRPPEWVLDSSAFDRPAMARIVTFLDERLAERLELADVARVTGLSPSHFERKFRLSTGMSVMKFRTGRRIRAALRRLQAAPESLPDLSTRLGFCSHSHFTRTFHAWTGMTPLRYMRSLHPAAARRSAPERD
jgi:AraC-like DNA-binding protein